jgi:hypothetical protein
MSVPALPKRLVGGVVLLLTAAALSGCAMEGPPGAARAQAGALGELVEQLKREDDEAEGQERAAARQASLEQQEQEAEREYEWR